MFYFLPEKLRDAEIHREERVKSLSSQEGLRLMDEFIAVNLFNLHAELRFVSPDPECGGYYEVQSLYENPEKKAKADKELTGKDLSPTHLLEVYLRDWERCQKNEKELCIRKKKKEKYQTWDICPRWSSSVKDAQFLLLWFFQEGIEVVHHMLNPYFFSKKMDKNDMPHTITLTGFAIQENGWTYPEALAKAIISYYKKYKMRKKK